MAKQIKEREKRLKIPALFFDGESMVPFEKFPYAMAYTDRVLSEVLQVSPMRISMWRKSNTIPYKMEGSFAVYNIKDCISALKAAGYSQDENLKSTKL